ncbi:MAG TPA: hypothetical protein VNT30_16995 [Stellaceae bacterium]|nr:hypothetical protein [Stellaceae bacterium]
MPLTDFSNFHYVPILGVRPAEMQALEELPSSDKDGLLPYIILQPWTTAKQLESTIVKLNAVIGSRPIIVDLTEKLFGTSARRPVHDQFDTLRDSHLGFQNWYSFVEAHDNYIPALQLTSPEEITSQISRISSLNRGIVVRLNENIFSFSQEIAKLFLGNVPQREIYFILDFQKQGRDILRKVANAVDAARKIREVLPESFFSVSASTFPETFVDIQEQEIFERVFHNLVVTNIGSSNTIYCDRASVRAERQSGGSGAPAPRIDNALPTKWEFFRVPNVGDRNSAYQRAAQRAIASPGWNDLGIWGTELIKLTAAGHDGAIISAKVSTAARINIHLHIQLGGGAHDMETVWTD